MWPISDLQYVFRSSRSTADLLKVVSNRVTTACNRCGATWAVAIDISKAFEFGMLFFFTNLGLMGFQVRYLALFLFLSVIWHFRWFWMGSLHKNIQFMLEFLKGKVLVLHFSYYMILSVILLSMLIILLSTLKLIRHLICGNNLNWLLNLNLIYETLWTGARSSLLISMLGKLNLFCLTGLVTMLYWCENGWVCSCGKVIFWDTGIDFLC